MDTHQSLPELARALVRRKRLLNPSDADDAAQDAQLILFKWLQSPSARQAKLSKEQLLWDAVGQAVKKVNAARARQSKAEKHYAQQQRTVSTPGGNALARKGKQGSWSHLLRRLAEADLLPEEQKILELRIAQMGYSDIAETVGLSRKQVALVCAKYLPQI